MKSKVSAYIQVHHLLKPEGEVLVALSGGPDSVALLLLLRELGYSVSALHCNFHLRADESDRDENFVRRLCQRIGVPLKVRNFETSSHARQEGISIEMAARQLRYEWFDEELRQRGAQCIAVAHHRDDQAETLLLNLLRGTGIRGLGGMKPANGTIVRPLLCVSRQEILDYLESRQQEYVTDSTNLEPIALRNKVRLTLLPLLRTLNPRIDDKLAQTCEHIQGTLTALSAYTHERFLRYGITDECFPLMEATEELPTLLHEWLRDRGFTTSQEYEMTSATDSPESKQWQSATHRIVLSHRSFRLYPIVPSTATPRLRQEIVSRPAVWEKGCAYFDADLLSQPLTLRPVAPGDRMRPFGMQGTKLLRDLMRELGLDPIERTRQFVVCHGQDILWLAGLRASDFFRVGPDTRRILRLSLASDQPQNNETIKSHLK